MHNTHCTFCGKTKSDVKKLIKGKCIDGSYTYICDRCVQKCKDAIEKPTPATIKNISRFIPNIIYDKLNEKVEGQEEAKRVLSVAAHTHYLRTYVDSNIEKSNILLIGPTGFGKTHLVEQLGEILDVPMVIIDATTLTEAGFAGDDVDVCIERLLQAANYDVELAERGIVLIDEVDKLKRSIGHGNTRDVSGEGVQQGLLKLLENSSITINFKKSMLEQSYTVNTKNILFIAAGAFAGLEDIVKQEISGSNMAIGSNNKQVTPSSPNHWSKHLNESHLIKYGLIPEFVGRLHIRTVLQELDESLLEKILLQTHDKAILKQMEKRLQLSGSKLTWTKGFINQLAKLVLQKKVGFRGARSIIENILQDPLFSLPGTNQQCVVCLNDDLSCTIQDNLSSNRAVSQ